MPRKKLYPDEKTMALSIRLPASLKKMVEQQAKKNRRSLNQEIIWLLEQAVEKNFSSPQN